MIFVTSYDSPDLDGVACAIAYSELLNKEGKKAKAVYYGELGLEVEFVRQFTDSLSIEQYTGAFPPDSQFILVDSADPDQLEKNIIPEKVIEIIDHHPLTFTDVFVNAQKTIELVGSCATLVTERLQRENFIPSREAIIYLYSAIISNTANFKNPITTERDRSAALYLRSLVELPDDYVKEMFSSKSKLTKDNLYEVIFQDFFAKPINGKRVGIGQIEIVDLDETVTRLWDELVVTLERIRKEDKLDYIFLVGIDLYKGHTMFVSIDEESRELFSKALSVPDLKTKHTIDFIMMRKQVWPKVDAVLENRS
ncbi:MAG: manganese-dependent inorganic pyrophosphatase [Parcubacteria group bacterium LiPW_41]|nr:MAG: manganese-dependent inorganic pyrophosphatase [Parcubacteria group bacterium LiPW_41]